MHKMQRIDNEGLPQELKEFDKDLIKEWLKDFNTDHVDVFEGTEENINTRKKMIGKPLNWKTGKGFKKVPTIKE